MYAKPVPDRPSREMVLGNHAIALGLIDAGVGYVASYPGTPSTEIMTFLIDKQDEAYHASWSTNEAVAMEEAIAASITGVDSAFICKSVGLNVAMDPLMTIVNSGTNSALVIVVADDPGMHSSQNEQDTRVIGAKLADIPVFEPSTPQEAYQYTREAVDLSRKFGMPVIIRTVTRLSHALAPIERDKPSLTDSRGFIPNTRKFVSIPGNARKNHHETLRIRKKIQEYANEGTFWKEILTDSDPEYLVITSGNAANYTIEAIDRLEISAHILIPKLISPLPLPKLHDLLRQYYSVLVIEELEPLLEDSVRIIASKIGRNNRITGKDVLTRREGELTIEDLRFSLAKFLGIDVPKKVQLPMVDDLVRMRPPVLCAGCPHRSSYVDLQSALKSFDPIYCNDIGCYSLGVMPPHKTADMLICMGASIPMATATSVTQPDRLAVAVIGDSTFWHSGLSGLANAIWKNADILVVIVDNSYTAMTGGQPNPSSHSQALDIANVVRAMGAEVFEINPMDFKESRRVIKEAANLSGVRVIVSTYPCVLRKDTQDSTLLQTKLIVEQDKCNGCSQCQDLLGCPAIAMVDNLAAIDNSLCTKCGLCIQVCRRDAIVRLS